jgi:thiamine-phosphate pyrophosphorylase
VAWTLPPLYPILDAATLDQLGLDLTAAAAAILEGGAKILQLRHKGHFSRELFTKATAIGALCREAGAIWIVDDRADMAKLLEAGVHLGQDDLPAQYARELLGEGPIIGFSTHNREQLEAALSEPVDYLALGPIFETGSKAKPDPVVGVDRLREWRTLTSKPLVAIGGITRRNAIDVLRAGADSVAVIGDLYPRPLPTNSARSLRERIEEWQTLLASR